MLSVKVNPQLYGNVKLIEAKHVIFKLFFLEITYIQTQMFSVSQCYFRNCWELGGLIPNASNDGKKALVQFFHQEQIAHGK